MRDPAKPIRRQRAATPPLDLARDMAVLTANTAMLTFAEGLWAPTVMAEQAYRLAVQILVLDEELGTVAEASYAERHIRVMSEAAHLVVQHARQALGDGTLKADPAQLPPLFDALVDELLVPVYGIMVVA